MRFWKFDFSFFNCPRKYLLTAVTQNDNSKELQELVIFFLARPCSFLKKVNVK